MGAVNNVQNQQPLWGILNGRYNAGRTTPVETVTEVESPQLTTGANFFVPTYNAPSVDGGSTGYYGPENRGGVVGKNFDSFNLYR